VAGHILADHELTTLVDAMFGPEAGPQALLVHAVCSFGDYTFEAVGSDELAGSDPPSFRESLPKPGAGKAIRNRPIKHYCHDQPVPVPVINRTLRHTTLGWRLISSRRSTTKARPARYGSGATLTGL
jgi:hypothetical protein